jgi:hypothetical protein
MQQFWEVLHSSASCRRIMSWGSVNGRRIVVQSIRQPAFFFEILYIKRARKVCTDLRAEKDKKSTHTIYLYKLIMEEMKTFIKVHSVCLEEGLLNEPTFPPLESCSDSAKDSVISLLPYEPDTSVKVFIKKGLLNWCLAFSIIW